MHKSLFLFVIRYCALIGLVLSHEVHGRICESSSEARIKAEYRPGIVTLDGHGDEWDSVYGIEFSLRSALDPDAENEFKGGKMTVKALHDGSEVFFLLKVDGDYVYTKGISNMCPSVALMFQVGDNASYHSMGGCKETKDACNKKNCRGHEVDIVQFSIGNAIPGRLYSSNQIDSNGNGDDRFGCLHDLYAWNPHCRYLDGMGPSGESGLVFPTSSMLYRKPGSMSNWQGLTRVFPQSNVLSHCLVVVSTRQECLFHFRQERVKKLVQKYTICLITFNIGTLMNKRIE